MHALRTYGVTRSDVTSVVGVSDRAVRGWSKSAIRPERYDKLAELRDLVIVLSNSLTARGVGQWLHARNRLLAGARPIEALAEGRSQDVRLAAQAFVNGSCV